MESMSQEHDRHSNVSPTKSSDPNRKKTFKIISVKKGGTGSGDLVTDDADSVDGLDESQTEDLSSEFCDSSKATDLDVDVQDTPLTPDEVTSTTTIVMKQKPDQNSQSRFKVVKIETKEPFRRGKWLCYDFFDTAPAAVVTLNGSKATEDSIIQSALSGTLSSSNSVHYVPDDVNESSSNLFVAPVVPLSPSSVPGQPILTDMFFPIQPAPANQVQSNMDGLTSVVTQYPQPIHMSVAGGASSSSSFHNVAQPGLTTIVQSLPHTNVFPYAQNGPSSLYNNATEKVSQPHSIQNPTTSGMAVGNGQTIIPATPVTVSNVVEDSTGGAGPSQNFPVTSPNVAPPSSKLQPQNPQNTSTAGVAAISPDELQAGKTNTSLALPGMAAAVGLIDGKTAEMPLADQMGPGMDESMSSVKTLEPGDTQDPSKLEEAVETMYIGLEGNEEDQDDEGGGSTVAIDNKIEQAMDLVKRHLMYAVREEVEILKQQIVEMMERIGQLEHENTVLRAEAKPETLNKLLMPRAALVNQAATQAGQQQQQIVQGQAATQVAGVVGATASQPQQATSPSGQQQTMQAPLGQQQQQATTPTGTATPTLQAQQQQQSVPQKQQQQQQQQILQQQQQVVPQVSTTQLPMS